VLRQLTGRDLWTAPEIRIPKARLGSTNAEWCIATGGLGPDAVVYCAGIGTDVTFDVALIERFGCDVHAVDPTPRSTDWIAGQALPDKFKFYPLGFAGHDGALEFSPPDRDEHVSTPRRGGATPSSLCRSSGSARSPATAVTPRSI